MIKAIEEVKSRYNAELFESRMDTIIIALLGDAVTDKEKYCVRLGLNVIYSKMTASGKFACDILKVIKTKVK